MTSKTKPFHSLPAVMEARQQALCQLFASIAGSTKPAPEKVRASNLQVFLQPRPHFACMYFGHTIKLVCGHQHWTQILQRWTRQTLVGRPALPTRFFYQSPFQQARWLLPNWCWTYCAAIVPLQKHAPHDGVLVEKQILHIVFSVNAMPVLTFYVQINETKQLMMP